MVGDVIYPLNQLKEIQPELYEAQKAKYAGRESVLDFRIPGLGILFNDTVHCAALDPRRLFEVRLRLGFPVPGAGSSSRMTGSIFAIPLERITHHQVVWYSGKTLWINGAPDEDVPMVAPDNEFEPFNPAIYHELLEPTPAHLAYLNRQKEDGRLALMFVHIPHILVAGPIDVRGLEPIKWEVPHQ